MYKSLHYFVKIYVNIRLINVTNQVNVLEKDTRVFGNGKEWKKFHSTNWFSFFLHVQHIIIENVLQKSLNI